ncbi:MAG: SpoIIE family protein phosphatase [Actinobacteria bacterium]|nr:SpoIIE family protein phosphatase [Actinomycetota bacterium]MBW3650198.1 SpoIIE family protein phosphatase [Actinomycetota bacterium]
MPYGGEALDDPERLDALRRTGLLDSPPDPGFDRLTRLATRLLKAPVSLVSLVDDHRQYFKSFTGLTGPAATARETPLSQSFCQHVVTTGEPLVVADAPADERVATNLAIPELGVRSYAGVPLISPDGHPIGAFCVIDAEARTWSDEELEILRELAGSVMTEIELRNAVHQAEEAQRRLALLAQASALLATLDSSQTLEQLARLAVTTLADWCSIVVVDEDGISLSRVCIAHADPDKQDLVERLRQSERHDPSARTGVAEVIRSGRPQLISLVDADFVARLPQADGYRQIVVELGFSSAMLVPLAARGRTLGAITFARGAGPPYGDQDLYVAADLGRRAALALDNARAYEAQREIASTLQRSLLPPALPSIRHFKLAAAYKTPGDTVLVGGDFYDVFPLRGTGWGVVIGDVQGKGSAAASLTALARYTVRAGALTLRNPKQVLRALNEAVLQEGERFLTVCLATLQPAGEGIRGRVCVAGHPLPLVVRADGVVEPVGRPGTLLGVVRDVELSVVTFELRPGDLLVLFTDGLVEARRDGAQFGISGVERVLRGCAGLEPGQVVGALDAAVTDFVGGPPRDDMAILALGRTAATAP